MEEKDIEKLWALSAEELERLEWYYKKYKNIYCYFTWDKAVQMWEMFWLHYDAMCRIWNLKFHIKVKTASRFFYSRFFYKGWEYEQNAVIFYLDYYEPYTAEIKKEDCNADIRKELLKDMDDFNCLHKRDYYFYTIEKEKQDEEEARQKKERKEREEKEEAERTKAERVKFWRNINDDYYYKIIKSVCYADEFDYPIISVCSWLELKQALDKSMNWEWNIWFWSNQEIEFGLWEVTKILLSAKRISSNNTMDYKNIPCIDLVEYLNNE